jgi:hypothetical protein
MKFYLCETIFMLLHQIFLAMTVPTCRLVLTTRSIENGQVDSSRRSGAVSCSDGSVARDAWGLRAQCGASIASHLD